MKIVFASTYPPTHCGVGEYTRMLVTALHSLDLSLDIIVLADRASGVEPRYDSLAKVQVYPVFQHEEYGFRGILDKLVEMNGADILHIQHEYGIFGKHNGIIKAVEEARDEGLVKKIFITMHTVDHPFTQRDGTLGFQAQLNIFDKVIVHSILQEFELIHQGVEPVKLVRIPHGTLLNPYLWMPRYMLVEELGLLGMDIKGFIIAVPGFLRRDKGLDLLIHAVKPLLKETGENYTVIVAGEVRDEKLKEEIEEMVENGPNLVFLEKYMSNDEILKLVALADAVILPYRDRPAAYAVSGILHLSMGGMKAIIGTRTPRLIELYTNAPRMTVPTRSPRELARKIRWLRENYDVAIAYMSQLYSYAVRTQWPRVARRHLHLYMGRSY